MLKGGQGLLPESPLRGGVEGGGTPLGPNSKSSRRHGIPAVGGDQAKQGVAAKGSPERAHQRER